MDCEKFHTLLICLIDHLTPRVELIKCVKFPLECEYIEKTNGGTSTKADPAILKFSK